MVALSSPPSSVQQSGPTILRRFLTTLVFSWLANPLGVGIAHVLGVSQEPTLVMVLLASSTCTPYQIFLNESVAVRRASGRHGASVSQFIALLTAQSITCIAALVTMPHHRSGLASAVAITAVLGCTAVLSYAGTARYYALTLEGRISSREAAFVGFLPGLTSICLYLGASTVIKASTLAADVIIYLVAVLPTAAVFFYVSRISPGFHIEPPSKGARTLSSSVVVGVVASITVLTFGGARLRDIVATFRNEYAALILVALNSMASLVTTLTRAAFLRSSALRPLRAIGIVSIVVGLLGVGLIHTAQALGCVLLLLSTQGLIIAMLEFARRSR